MAKSPKKRSGSGKHKKRVEFRKNRSPRTRATDWTHIAGDEQNERHDVPLSERLTGKGELSRKRTIIVDEKQAKRDTTRAGLVVEFFGRIATVDDGEQRWPCTVRRVLRTRSTRDRGALVVGDHVRFAVNSDREGVEVEGVIEFVEPRKSELKRLVGRREHIVVANVDQAVIVTSAVAPTPKPHLVDRYIVSALHGRMTPIICLNKTDLTSADEITEILSIYEACGYQTLGTSAATGSGIDRLRGLLADRKTVVAGQSGVGKSSLLNAVQPGLALKVGTVTEETGKGRHTTSTATLIELEVGGYVVDTPGVRSFDLFSVPRALLETYFVEFIEHVPHCKFPDCTHTHENPCAVKTAVADGTIHPSRYEGYVRLFTDVDSR